MSPKTTQKLSHLLGYDNSLLLACAVRAVNDYPGFKIINDWHRPKILKTVLSSELLDLFRLLKPGSSTGQHVKTAAMQRISLQSQ